MDALVEYVQGWPGCPTRYSDHCESGTGSQLHMRGRPTRRVSVLLPSKRLHVTKFFGLPCIFTNRSIPSHLPGIRSWNGFAIIARVAGFPSFLNFRNTVVNACLAWVYRWV